MANDIKTSSVAVAASTSLGNQVITGAGFTPKAALITLIGATVNDTARMDARIVTGAVTGTSNQWSCGYTTDDAVTTSAVRSYGSKTALLFGKNAGGANQFRAIYVSFDADGITIDWTDPPPDPWMIHITFFGGVDLNAEANTVAPGAQDNETNVTSPGFEPDAVFSSFVDDPFDEGGTSSARTSWGWTLNDTVDVNNCVSYAQRNAQTTTAVFGRVSTDRCLVRLDNSGSILNSAEITTFDASGFSVFARDGTWATAEMGYLALEFDGLSASVDIVDSPTGTGNDSETAPGFTPQLSMRFMSMITAADTDTGDNTSGAPALSIITSSVEETLNAHSEDNVTTTNEQSFINSKAVNFLDASGVEAFDGTFSSFDATGDTINYTVADGTIRKWVLFAVEAATQTFNETGSGGAITGGSAAVSYIANPSVSGGAVTGGSATVALINTGQPITVTEDNKFRHHLESPSTPAAAREAKTSIQASDTVTAVYQASAVLDVSEAREVTLLIKHSAGAAGNIPELLVLLSDQDVRPVATDDVWYIPNETDGSITAALPGGTVFPGAGFTLTPEFARVTARPLQIRMETTDGINDEQRVAVTVKCTWAKWCHVQYVDASGTALGVIVVDAVRTV